MPPPIAPTARLRARLDALADALEEARFDLPAGEQEDRRRLRDVASSSIRRYLLPRLGDLEAPLLVVVFGPTGSGKSTLVNSLAGDEVSAAGTLRPTTREAVLWCHRRHRDRYQRHPITDTGPVRVVADDHPILDRVTLVDTPDVDSVVVEHRRQTEQVLAIADAAVYVTTAQRYADAVPWELLSAVTRRRTPLLVVANRLSRRSGGIVGDLASLMRDAGIDAAARADDILTVQEHRLRSGGRLPTAALRRVSRRLDDLAFDRARVVKRSIAGTLDAALADAAEVAEALDRQAAQGQSLIDAAHLGYQHQREEAIRHLEAGDLVRGEVVDRWQRLVGVSDLARMVTGGLARLRGVLLPGGPVPGHRVHQVGAEARTELVELTLLRARRAVAAAESAWGLDPAGEALLTPELRRVGSDTRQAAEAEVDDWLAGLVDLVVETGGSRFRLGRVASIGVNAAATVLLVGVFVSTGGLTGAEAGIAAGAAAANQTVLEHLFGQATARRLADRARAQLADGLERVLELDAARYEAAVAAAMDDPELASTIRRLISEVAEESELVPDG